MVVHVTSPHPPTWSNNNYHPHKHHHYYWRRNHHHHPHLLVPPLLVLMHHVDMVYMMHVTNYWIPITMHRTWRPDVRPVKHGPNFSSICVSRLKRIPPQSSLVRHQCHLCWVVVVVVVLSLDLNENHGTLPYVYHVVTVFTETDRGRSGSIQRFSGKNKRNNYFVFHSPHNNNVTVHVHCVTLPLHVWYDCIPIFLATTPLRCWITWSRIHRYFHGPHFHPIPLFLIRCVQITMTLLLVPLYRLWRFRMVVSYPIVSWWQELVIR